MSASARSTTAAGRLAARERVELLAAFFFLARLHQHQRVFESIRVLLVLLDDLARRRQRRRRIARQHLHARQQQTRPATSNGPSSRALLRVLEREREVVGLHRRLRERVVRLGQIRIFLDELLQHGRGAARRRFIGQTAAAGREIRPAD